jgi:hypothetical protein
MTKLTLTVRCPTCGTAPGEKCELPSGQPRTGPHRDRRILAIAELLQSIETQFLGVVTAALKRCSGQQRAG